MFVTHVICQEMLLISFVITAVLALVIVFFHMLVLYMFLDAGCESGCHITTFIWTFINAITMPPLDVRLKFIWSVLFNTTFTCSFGPLCGTIPCMSFNFIVTWVSSFPLRRSLGFFLRSFMCSLHKFINRIHSCLAVLWGFWKHLLHNRILSSFA